MSAPDPEAMERLEFWVEGVPIPQGSKKGFIVKKRVVIVDDNAEALKPWRALCALAALEARAGREFVGAVSVFLDFYLPRPKSVTRRHPHVRPDVDKLTRAILDSLTTSGVFKDDGQVVTVHAVKRYADDKPGVLVAVRELA